MRHDDYDTHVNYTRAKNIKNYYHGKIQSEKILFAPKTEGIFVVISKGICTNGELFRGIGFEYDIYLEYVWSENFYYVLDIDTHDSFATKLQRIRSSIVHPLIKYKEFTSVIPEFKEGIIMIVNYHVSDYKVYKWKRPEDQTVDLLVNNNFVYIEGFVIPCDCEDGVHEYYLSTMKYKQIRRDKSIPNSDKTIATIRKAMSVNCLCVLVHGSCSQCTQKQISQEEFESLYLITPEQDRYKSFVSYDLSNIDFEKIRVLVPPVLAVPSEMTVIVNEILSGGNFVVLDAIRYGFWYNNGKWIRETHSYRALKNYWNTFMHYMPELRDFLGYNYREVSPGIYYWGDLPTVKDFITVDLASLTYISSPVVDSYHTRDVLNKSINFGVVNEGKDFLVDFPIPIKSIEYDIIQFLTREFNIIGMISIFSKYSRFINVFPSLFSDFRRNFVIRDKQHEHIMDTFKK